MMSRIRPQHCVGLVDPEGPEVVEILAPRMDSIIPIDALDELQINVQISELEQIDADSLVLQWKVTRGADASVTPLVRGDTPLEIAGSNLAGQSIIAGALLNIEIPDEYFSSDLRFHIWVEGQDMAGNAFQTQGIRIPVICRFPLGQLSDVRRCSV